MVEVARVGWTAACAGVSGALPGLGCHGLRQPIEVGLVRRLPVKAGVGSPSIVEGQIPADRGPGLADRVVGPEVDLLVLDRSPEPLDEDVVAPGALAVHADGDAGLAQHAGEVVAGELAARVGVEDLGAAMAGEGFLQRLDAEPRLPVGSADIPPGGSLRDGD